MSPLHTDKDQPAAMKCNYNKCYVAKQGLTCKDGKRQLLNGCCGTTPEKRTFPSGCKHKDYDFGLQPWNINNRVQYCLNHADNNNVGTTDRTDDQKDGKLVVENIDVKTPCSSAGPK